MLLFLLVKDVYVGQFLFKLVKPFSISKTVKGIIDNDLSLQDALSRRYANYTAIARLIKPKVEHELGRKVNIEKTRISVEAARNLIATHQEDFLQVSESNTAVTMIFDQKLLPDVHKRFNDEDILDEQSDLAAIIVHSPSEIVRTPGVILAIYAKIAENHVNIEDTVSCFTDTIIIIRMDE